MPVSPIVGTTAIALPTGRTRAPSPCPKYGITTLEDRPCFALSEHEYELIDLVLFMRAPCLPELVSGHLENLVRRCVTRSIRETQDDLDADFADDLQDRDLEIEVLARLAKLPSASEIEKQLARWFAIAKNHRQ